jgi:hypothetical protein
MKLLWALLSRLALASYLPAQSRPGSAHTPSVGIAPRFLGVRFHTEQGSGTPQWGDKDYISRRPCLRIPLCAKHKISPLGPKDKVVGKLRSGNVANPAVVEEVSERLN